VIYKILSFGKGDLQRSSNTPSGGKIQECEISFYFNFDLNLPLDIMR
jgi:hypothetical protein